MSKNTAPQNVDGVLQIKGRVGFVLAEDPVLGDILVEGPTLRLAMDGDRVRAEVTSAPPGGRRTGKILEVLSRARFEVVGAYGKWEGRPALWIENDAQPLLLEPGEAGRAPGEGELVVARITRWPSLQQPSQGKIVEILGPRSEPTVELQALIRKHALPRKFPADVEQMAEAFGEAVVLDAYKERETFFEDRVCTIDGADAKDFDDAVSLQSWPGGHPDNRATRWRLAVHIADVAHYVRENSPLDEEALLRGTSVYLSGTVIPMLPFPLSDGLCSLRPETVRLTLTCIMDIDATGQVIADRVLESAIRSTRRFTYEQVENLLKSAMVPGVSEELRADVLEMGRLAQLLRKARFARGSLDFDFPEAYVQMDPQGRPLGIGKRERLESHRLIEDFMLLANETVARRFQKQPFIYRIHETPDAAKLQKLRLTLGAAGITVPRGFDTGDPAALQQVLHAAEGKPTQAIIHTSVLRSLKQAVYSAENRGHYGLASKCYTHFTSPIRRYPDLVVHRIVKEHLHSRYRPDHWKTVLPEIAAHCSQRERLAVTAEREFLDLQKVRFMEQHVGETFDGIVTGVTNFGLFVQLNKYFVEGLVHISNLKGDYYLFDEVRMTLRGKRNGRTFGMGQKVSVLVAAANPVKRQLDLELVSDRNSRSEPPVARAVRPAIRRTAWPNTTAKTKGKPQKSRGRRRR